VAAQFAISLPAGFGHDVAGVVNEAGAGVTGRAALVLFAARLGALALEIAYERWSAASGEGDFGEVARRALDEVLAAGPWR
jgi:NADPH:quinone reductase-like Zn-dependent oxidoreductase